MRAGTRWGVVTGCALTPVTMRLLYDYHPDTVGPATLWLAVAAPVVVWLSVETAVRARRRARRLSHLLVLVGMIAAGWWGWWLDGLLATGPTAPTSRIAITIAGIALYTAAAVFSGLALSRKHTRAAEPATSTAQ
jgi:hypothetical protein